MKAFFHSSDFDGHCSGAIVKYRCPECEMIGINYGQDFPWDIIGQDEVVYMVDFTLQPFEDMELLSNSCKLVWIDHHKTEVEEARKRNFRADGARHIGIGACQIVWKHLFPLAQIPKAISLLAEYDVWNHAAPNTLPFQYGFRMFRNTWPDNQALWRGFFDSDDGVEPVVKVGNTIIAYEKNQNEKFCNAYVFETVLGEHRAVCCNRGFANSQIFDSVWDPAKYDLMITFIRMKLPARKWTVSLYSTKPDIDCGKIARVFGGGGHVGAAGFSCEQLPFEH